MKKASERLTVKNNISHIRGDQFALGFDKELLELGAPTLIDNGAHLVMILVVFAVLLRVVLEMEVVRNNEAVDRC